MAITMKRFLVPAASSGTPTKTRRASSGGKRLTGRCDATHHDASNTANTETLPAGPPRPRPRKIGNHSDLDVLYYPKLLPDGSISGCGLANLPLEQTSIIMFGKSIEEPRLTCYFGTKPLKYSGSVRNPRPFPDELDDIRKKIEALPEVKRALEIDTTITGVKTGISTATGSARSSSSDDNPTHHNFTGCLANLYLDGSHYMGFHRDDEPENGPSRSNRVIASVTLGESRRFVFKRDSDGARVEIDLEPGSLLLMKGRTQSLWKHSVPKTSKSLGKRLNLTFRVII